MRGDKPKPAQLKALKASGKEAEKLLRTQTPTPGPLVDPPEWLTGEQKAEWAYAIENAPREVLRCIDKSLLVSFIVAQDLHRQACLEIQRSDLLVTTSKSVTANPYLQVINKQAQLMMRAASELGFTPCSRARIDAGKPPVPAPGAWQEMAKAS